MKEEVINQKPVALDAIQVPNTPATPITIDNVDEELLVKKENSSKNAAQLPVKIMGNQYTITPETSSIGNDDNCVLPTKDVPGCVTKDFTIIDNVTVDMPATVKNPLKTVAILTFKMTVCFDKSGNVTISYRNVIASNRDYFPVDKLVEYWSTLSSPALEEAIEEYTNVAANKMETMMTTQFLKDNLNIDVLESRYFKGLCYITCIYKDTDGILKTAKTACGDKCCKRVRKINRKPKGDSYTVLLTEYFETGGNCIGAIEKPCTNAIKITNICEHSCQRSDEVIEDQ